MATRPNIRFIFGWKVTRVIMRRIDDWLCSMITALVVVLGCLAAPAAVQQAAADVAARHEITHLVHNAGLIWPNPVEDAVPEDIAGLAQLHLGAALTLLQASLPAMKARGFGRVLFNGSRAALGVPTRTAYSATKAGMIGMTKSLAQEVAARGITANCIAPGFIETAMTDALADDQKEKLLAQIPAGKLGSPEDIAAAALFLASGEAGYMTGQTLHVNGGMAMV